MKRSNTKRKIICMIFVLLVFCLVHIPAQPCGDVNSDGAIDILDALLTAQYYVELDPEGFDPGAADVNGDGNIDILDALLIARYYVGLIDELPGCDEPTPTPGGESITYELQAEDEEWSSGVVETNHDGYTGTGFVNTDNASGEWIEWSFDLSADSTAECVFRYACASGNRPMDLSINGSVVTNLDFPASGAWNSWATQASNTVNLNAGSVAIRLTATASGGAANMDKMDITITGGEIIAPTTPPTPEPTDTPGPTETPGPETPTPTPVTGQGHPDNDQDPHGYGRNTTGGGNASPQTVTSASAFSSAVSGSGSAVIIVDGNLNTGSVNIGSNKTIIGANGNARIRGGTIRVRSNNVIFKNLIIGGASDDAMEISGASNIFIHKCTFVDGGDGSCDIVRAADNITLSWCKFYYTTSHDHRFPLLIGNSDSATGDSGNLHVTIHHTWFDNGCIERLPRVRFGYVHLYNNYYGSNTTFYCIGLGVECHVQVENSYFDDQPQLWYDWGGSSSGILGWNNLHLTGQSTIPGWMDNDFPAWSIPYDYNLDPAESTKNLVMTHAGSS